MTQNLPEPNHVVADKYVIEASLGVGGMGAVYAVTHRITGKKLALKCLLPQYLDHPELVERFMREAQAAGRIQHRHVVDVFDVGRDGSVLYMVMPLLEGKSLSTLLRERTHSLSELLAILLRTMEGVAAAHAQGIVHRDLKPDNIFVCVGPSGRLDDPKVLDFGISKLDDEGEGHALTKSGVLMGTPHYMSFEQLNSQRDVDARADVYALGVILYETLAGELPYLAESAPALAIRMMSGAPKPLSALRPDLPPALAHAVMKAIERDRDLRFESVTSLQAAVAPFVDDADVHNASAPRAAATGIDAETVRSAAASLEQTVHFTATVLDTTPPARLTLHDEPERLHRPKTSHAPLILLVGAALALVLGLALTFWLNRNGAPEAATPTEPAPPKRAQTAQPSPPEASDERPTAGAKRRVKRRRIKRPSAGSKAQVTAQEEADEYEEYEEEEEEENSEAPRSKDPGARAEENSLGTKAADRAAAPRSEPSAPGAPPSEPAQPTHEAGEPAPSPSDDPTGLRAPALRPGTSSSRQPAPPPPLPDKLAPVEAAPPDSRL